jgi:hypothetical protein
MNRRLLAVPAVLGAAAVLAAPASADVIKPGVRMAGVKVGESAKDVRATYGKPDKTRRDADNAYTYWYKKRRLEIAFQNDTISQISSKSRLDRTDNGLGRGSTLARLHKGLFNEKCDRFDDGTTYCQIFTRNLKRATGFSLNKAGVVVRVDVGYVQMAYTL